MWDKRWDKRLNKLFIHFIFLLMISFSAEAQVYRCENAAGEINFSDEPCSKSETGKRLNWLNGTTSTKKAKQKTSRSSVSTQEKKTAQKAKKNNEAYVLLSLLTTTQLELETASLRSTLDGETTDTPELVLSDGITVNLLKVDKMFISYKIGSRKLQARFVMNDGYEEEKTINKPFPKISGEAKIGSFSKSLEDIKKIEFFNSKKLLNTMGNKSDKTQSVSSKKPLPRKQLPVKMAPSEAPVIELDLSHQIPVTERKKSVKNPQVKVVKDKSISNIPSSAILVDFVSQKQAILNKLDLSSSKGGKKSRGQHFWVSDKEQIPYDAIKTIKVRPTAKNQLLVAVELKTKEIKMEVMSPPFTRVVGKSRSGVFDHSLSEIKSISFKR